MEGDGEGTVGGMGDSEILGAATIAHWEDRWRRRGAGTGRWREEAAADVEAVKSGSLVIIQQVQ